MEEVCADLVVRLDARHLEIEQAILARVRSVPGAVGAEDDEYLDGLKRAVSAGVSYGLGGIERGEAGAEPIPAVLFSQARRAARSGITPEVALRRFFAGYSLFGEFIMRASEDGAPLPGAALGSVLHSQSVRAERLVVAVMGEYMREKGHRRPPELSRVKQVKELLAGEAVDSSELSYELEDWHIGAVARGGGATGWLREIAQVADRRLLLVRPDGETAWAWLGGRRRIEVDEIARHASSDGPGDALVALGEPARGVKGWRLTHQQANAASRISRKGARGVIAYAAVGLLASISQDQVLAASLRQMYLAPLADGRDGGAGLRDTLRAYFSAGRNVSSAAFALGVSRQTVGHRLRTVEEKLGRTLESCAPEVEVALRLENCGNLIDLNGT